MNYWPNKPDRANQSDPSQFGYQPEGLASLVIHAPVAHLES